MRFRSARPRLREGDEAQLAQVALGIDQPAVGQDGAGRGAGLAPVVRRVAVVITAGHPGRGALTLGPRGLAA